MVSCLRSAELREVALVAATSDRAFLVAARLLAAAIRDQEQLWLGGHPLTVGRLRGEIGRLFLEAGLRQPNGNLIAVGAEAAEPHHEGDDARRIRVGEGVLVDLFPASSRLEQPLFSDCSRTFCVGQETERAQPLVRAAEHVVAVKNAVEAELAEQLSRDGVARGFDLQRLACDRFRSLGWPAQVTAEGVVETLDEGYVHGLGHGVGRELHQHPTFSAEFWDREEGMIRAGQAITIEPGLYVPGKFGLRYEDLWLVEPGTQSSSSAEPRTQPQARLRRLTRLPWALDPKEFLAQASRHSERASIVDGESSS